MNNYLFIPLIFYITIFILQCRLIYKGKKENVKHFTTFKSIFYAIFCSIFVFYRFVAKSLIFAEDVDLNDAIMLILTTIAITVTFVVQWIIGMIIEKISKKKNSEIKIEKFNFNIFAKTFVIFIIVCIFTFIINTFGDFLIKVNIENNTIKYLNTKYGDYNFRVINIEKEYGYNGIVDKYLTGYKVTVTSDEYKYKKTFIVSVDKDRKRISDSYKD